MRRREQKELDPNNNSKGFFVNRTPGEVALRVGLLGAGAAGGLVGLGYLVSRFAKAPVKKVTMGDVSPPKPKPNDNFGKNVKNQVKVTLAESDLADAKKIDKNLKDKNYEWKF